MSATVEDVSAGRGRAQPGRLLDGVPAQGAQAARSGPVLSFLGLGISHPLTAELTTVGRGDGVDILLDDPSVSPLHAEITRRGPVVYVADLGLSRRGTRVNGRPVARRVLADGDVVAFGAVRGRVSGLGAGEQDAGPVPLRRSEAPDLTPRELDVVRALCRPADAARAFVTPATVATIARELVVTEAAVKQHLVKLYAKFRIPEGPDRRSRLANEVLDAGVVRAQRGEAEAPAPPR